MCGSIMEVGDGLTTLSTCSHLHWVLERSVSKLNVCFCVSFFFFLLAALGLCCSVWASLVVVHGLQSVWAR